MMIPRLLVTVAFWTLLAAPACCAAGWIAHPCACDEAEAAGEVCDHDSECGDDPCGTALVVHAPDGGRRIDAAPPSALVPVASAPGAAPAARIDGPAGAGASRSFSIISDTPLRL